LLAIGIERGGIWLADSCDPDEPVFWTDAEAKRQTLAALAAIPGECRGISALAIGMKCDVGTLLPKMIRGCLGPRRH